MKRRQFQRISEHWEPKHKIVIKVIHGQKVPVKVYESAKAPETETPVYVRRSK